MAAEDSLLLRIIGRDEASRSVNRVQSSIIRVVGAVASLNAAFRTLAFPVQQAIEFESALSDIQKTTGFTDTSIKALGQSLRDLSIEIGVSATELASIAAAAGQLGLGNQGRQAILAFTDTVARFATVADLSVDAAGTSIAKISNLFQIPINQAERVSSAFNELSNTTVATADQLVDIVRRIGSAGGLLEFAETAAIAATSLELGQTVEVAGTAVTKAFANMRVAAADFAELQELSTDQWVENLQTSGIQALKDVISTIGELEGVAQGAEIRNLFGGGRQFAFISRLVEDAQNDFKILDATLANSRNQFDLATSSIEEFANKQRSTQRQIGLTTVAFTDLSIVAGQRFLPAFRDVLGSLRDFATSEETINRVEAFADNLLAAAQASSSFLASFGPILPSLETFVSILTILSGLVVLRSIIGLFAGLATPIGVASNLIGGFGKLVTLAVTQVAILVPALTGLGNAFLLFSGKIAAAATAARAVLLGPAGIVIAIAAGIALLIPQVREALGDFVDLFRDGTDELAASNRATLREVERDIAAFQEALESNNGRGIEAVNLDSKNVDDLIAKISKQIGIVGQLQGAIRGATSEQQRLREEGERTLGAYDDVTASISNLERQQLSFQEKASTASQGAAASAQESLRRVTAELDTQRQRASLLERQIANVQRQYSQVGDAGARFSAEFQTAVVSLTQVLSNSEFRAIQANLQLDEQRRSLIALRKEIRELGSLDASALDEEAVSSNNARLLELEQQSTSTEIAVADLTEVVDELAPALKGAIPESVLATLRGFDNEVQDGLVKSLGDVRNNLETVVFSTSGAVRELTSLVATLIQAEAQAPALKLLSDRATETAKSVSGIFDNLPSVIAATRQQLADFVSRIDDIPAQRRLTIRLSTEREDITDLFDKEQARITKRFEDAVARIQDIDSGAGQRRLTQLTRQRDRSIEIAESTRDTSQAQLELQGATEKFNNLLERSAQLRSQAGILQKQINDLSADGRTLDAEGVRQQTQLLERMKLVQSQIRSINPDILASAESFGSITSEVGEIDRALGKELIPDALFDEFATQAKESIQANVTALGSLVEAGGQAAIELKAAAQEIGGIDSVTKSANERIEQLLKGLGATQSLVKGIRENLEQGFNSETGLVGLLDRITKFGQSGFDIPVRFNDTEEVRRLSSAIQDAALSVPISFETQQAINQLQEEGVNDVAITVPVKVTPEKSVTEVIDEGPRDVADVDLSVDDSNLRRIVDKEYTAKLKLEVDVVGGNLQGEGVLQDLIPAFASGGGVRGPGTGTSDSILARLSNGEYVMDALTTSRFGSGFFASLQKLARRGVSVPKFANGGPVGSVNSPRGVQGIASAAGGLASDVVRLVLDMGDESVELTGDRADVERLQRRLKNVTKRGGIR